MDELCDVIEGNRHYVKCLYVYNKIDQTSLEEVERICNQARARKREAGPGWRASEQAGWPAGWH